MIEAGLVLQVAAAIYDDLNAHHVQSYGPEARSNAARSEVIISDGDIDYPKATQVDAMVATTREALEQYGSDLKTDAVVLVEEDVEVPPLEGRKIHALPLARTAEEKLGKPNLIYVVALGALIETTRVVTKPALEAAMKDHVPRGGEQLYMKALEEGYKLGAGLA
jgi:2-oxoglutarate ferredoxin oxidoreductase subunit gamma